MFLWKVLPVKHPHVIEVMDTPALFELSPKSEGCPGVRQGAKGT